MIFGYKTANDKKIEELEKKIEVSEKNVKSLSADLILNNDVVVKELTRIIAKNKEHFDTATILARRVISDSPEILKHHHRISDIEKTLEKTEEIEKKIVSFKDVIDRLENFAKKLSGKLEEEQKYTKERFIEYIDERTTLYTGLHDRIEKIESIGDFEVLMKRVARVEEQFGPIMGKVNDTFSSAMQSLISEAGKTNQYIAGLLKESQDEFKEMILTLDGYGPEDEE